MRRLLLLFYVCLLGWNQEILALPHVAVGQIVEHPALDMLRQSLKEGLEKLGYKDGETLVWTEENAQGDPTIAVQIGHKLVSLQPSVIVTLSTPMAQAVASATHSIPIVFGAVTDPQAAKLTNHSHITGLTDFVAPKIQLELLQKILPNAQTIGVIYNSGEVNSRKQVDALKETAGQLGLAVVEGTVSKTSEVSGVVRSLIDQVDAFLLPTDNTVISALESILKIGVRHKIPVFGSDVDIVRRGAIAAYGVDWRESGLHLAGIVSSLLKGHPVSHTPIRHPERLVLHLNENGAQKIGISFSREIIEKADKIF